MKKIIAQINRNHENVENVKENAEINEEICEEERNDSKTNKQKPEWDAIR